MSIPFIFGLVGVLCFIYIWIGKAASKNLTSNEDYFLMGRKLAFFPLTLTLLATQLGGGTLIGAAQEAYGRGIVVLFYPLGVCLGLIILSLGFGKKLRELEVTTIAEIFEKVYRSKIQRYFASFLSIMTLFFILVSQVIACRIFLNSIGFNNPILLIILWTVFVTYTVMGGFKAVVNTDILQALFILCALALTIFSIDYSNINFSMDKASNNINEAPLVNWLLMPLFFMLIEQDTGQRCFAAKSGKTVKKSALSAAFLLLIGSCIAIFLGMIAKSIGIEAYGDTSILFLVVSKLTNPYVTSIFLVAILLAIISTADSLLCSIASNLSCDLITFQSISDRAKVSISKLFTFFIGVLALIVAFNFSSVINTLMISYELSVSILGVPTIFAVLLRQPSKAGAYFAIITGTAGFILFRIILLPIPKEIMTLLLSFGGYLIGSKIFKENKVIDQTL